MLKHSGTGASGIYPLLGCALDKRWTFTATGKLVTPCRRLVPHLTLRAHMSVFADVDGASLRHLRGIVDAPENESKRLQSRITIILRQPDEALIVLDRKDASQPGNVPVFHATMCNPPFYTSSAEMKESAEAKAQQPSAVSRALFPSK